MTPETMTPETVCHNEGTVSRGGIYTRLVFIEGGAGSFLALINPNDDLDGRFKAFDIDENEWLWVNGWSCDVTDYEGD